MKIAVNICVDFPNIDCYNVIVNKTFIFLLNERDKKCLCGTSNVPEGAVKINDEEWLEISCCRRFGGVAVCYVTYWRCSGNCSLMYSKH